MIILGVNSYHPDSSAAVFVDGRLIAACEEERFNRIKHFSGFPSQSIRCCLEKAGISIEDVDYITIPRKPNARVLKKIIYGVKIPSLVKHRLFAWKKTSALKDDLAEFFDIGKDKIKAEIVNIEHHRAHLASSFFVSGFNKAFLFSADALGDFASTVWGVGEGNKIRILGEIAFPHSLGFYYTAITQYLGFINFGDEYKVMGLAPYGEAAYEDEFKKILRIKNSKFELGLEYFLHHKKYIDMNFENCYPRVESIYSHYLEHKLGNARRPHDPLEKRHNDIAFCLQKRLEEVISYLINSTAVKGFSDLCLSGGVSHNCVVNGKLFDTTRFKRIYVPPAPGDAGLAIGSALYLWNQMLDKPVEFRMDHARWGPSFDDATLKGELRELVKKDNIKIEEMKDETELCVKVAREISDGKIVGWFQQDMELGPRALGSRSILADPRREDIKDILNSRIKQREKFRPFAPSILEEYTGEYFEHSHPSPFMSFAYKLKQEKKSDLIAACHVDQTARLQTVNRQAHPLYWDLINRFREITGVPILLNTSFNENEPIVCTPKEAVDCFLRTKMDLLALGNYIIKHTNV